MLIEIDGSGAIPWKCSSRAPTATRLGAPSRCNRLRAADFTEAPPARDSNSYPV